MCPFSEEIAPQLAEILRLKTEIRISAGYGDPMAVVAVRLMDRGHALDMRTFWQDWAVECARLGLQ
jgi:hypothetical protein